MLFDQAKDFITMMGEELQIHTQQRLKQIEDEIRSTGTYTHTFEELEYGAKVAWRNSNRCIGRLFWDSLKVRDLRHVKSKEEFIDGIKNHISIATNEGKIQPLVTVFPNEFQIMNEQLIRYAGYEEVGDPRSKTLTDIASNLGWQSSPSDFNVLPLIYSFNGTLEFYEYPKSLIKEVHIQHPDYPAFNDLHLKWYAVPIISNMYLEIGGIYYHTAPFNGWYMETEIGVRNFTDSYRYDKLKVVADAMEFDTSRTTTYWRDRALVELNYAVYHSYKNAKVSIVDHLNASKQFQLFEKNEDIANRTVTGKWSWLVPPLSPSLVHNYHYGFNDEMRSPNFLYKKPTNSCPFK